MAKLTRMDRTTARMLAREAESLLKPLEAKYGLKIRAAGGSYTDGLLREKFEFATVGKDGKANTKYAESFKLYASMIGLKPSDLGLTFWWAGGSVKLVGYRPRAGRYPFVVETSTGKLTCLPEQAKSIIIAARKK